MASLPTARYKNFLWRRFVEFEAYLGALGPLQITGVIGFFVYLLAFGAVQTGLMDGNGLSYSLSNMLAASLVGISLLAEFNLSSALIQASYILIGAFGVLRWTMKRVSNDRTGLNT